MDKRIPIACSLAGNEARRRWEDWSALRAGLSRVERSEHRFEIHFVADDATRTELTRLVDAERECCGFVDWEFEDLGHELKLVVSGDSFGVTAMAEAFQL